MEGIFVMGWEPSRVRPFLALTTCLALASCGSTSLILKPPLVAGCQRAALRSCPELADGVIAYVEGDKEKAEEKIREGIAGAAPEKVKVFIKALEALDQLPGSDKFMGPVHDVIAMLEGTAPPSSQSSAAESASPSGSAVASSGGTASSTSTTPANAAGFSHLRAATAVVVGNPQAKTCTALTYAGGASPSALCLRAAIGPLIITDLDWSPGCGAETFVLAGDPDQPIWFLRSDEGRAFSMHGAALIIPADAPFFIGHRMTSATPLRPSVACAVTWAGRRPGGEGASFEGRR
jgi:hypothetical protein